MGVAGRPAKPTAVHKLDGTYRPDRHAGALEYEAALLPCPKHLKGHAKAMWLKLAPRLFAKRVLTEADATALELLCQAYADLRDAQRVIAKHGTTYETVNQSGSVIFRPRPEVAMRADAHRRVADGLAMFGLSPASRAKVKADEAPQDDPLAALLGGVGGRA